MDSKFKIYFIDRWRKYFDDADLPICYFYSNQIGDYELSHTKNEHRCMICNLNRVREGFPYVYWECLMFLPVLVYLRIL